MSRPTITAARAAAIAVAFVQTVLIDNDIRTLGGISLRAAVRQTHGAAIDWASLRAVPWLPYLSESPARQPTDSIPAYVRRYLGQHYHALFEAHGRIVADVTVATYATGVELSVDGRRIISPPHGEEVHVEGIPAPFGDATLLIPEDAARLVATAAHARVASVPRLIAPWHHYAPIFSRWLVRLDRPVAVILQSGERTATQEVMIGYRWDGDGAPEIGWYVPAVQQLQEDSFEFPDSGGSLRSIALRMNSTVPNTHVPITWP